jgi:myo-inositol-1(or 4)-monophosphatase
LPLPRGAANKWARHCRKLLASAQQSLKLLRRTSRGFTRKTCNDDPRTIRTLAHSFDPAVLASRVEAILHDAGRIALDYFRPGRAAAAEVTHKHCGSPVTEADLHIDDFLRASLPALAPECGWLSEETADGPERLGRRRVFIVDPIDGTRGFASGDPCFAICVAVVADGRPELGIVHAPALGQTFVATRGGGATLNGAPIRVSARENIFGARLAAPDALVADLRRSGLDFAQKPRLPSLAMRLLRVADGELDGALANRNACDWDIAAADLILQEAGGVLTDFEGQAPIYNRADPKHPALAAGPPGLQRDLIAAARKGKRQL